MRAMPIAVAILTLMTAPGALADPVAVNPEGDAHAEFVAVSGTGNANASLLAVSGTGNASRGLVAASGTGNANARIITVSGTGNAVTGEDAYYTHEYLAVSGTGNASGFLAISGTGNATGSGTQTGECPSECGEDQHFLGNSGFGISGTGSAWCWSWYCAVASGTGNSSCSDCLAPVSATGHATCGQPWFVGCRAVSACDQLAARGRPEACT